MVHHSKDKVPRKLMDMYPQSLVDWIGKNYEVIECKSPVIMDSDGNEGIADGLITVIKRLPEGIEKTENLPFIFNPEIQSSWVTPKILIRSHGYCNKACLQYGMPVEPFFISTVELKSRKASVEIVKGEKFTVKPAQPANCGKLQEQKEPESSRKSCSDRSIAGSRAAGTTPCALRSVSSCGGSSTTALIRLIPKRSRL